ncbi:MAG: MFS transporter [Ferrovibrio sp.]|uniref:MFS transporter n=1 Tax=Ferrovibrio sp. TaxID=1917215 RepID=UPI00391BC47B
MTDLALPAGRQPTANRDLKVMALIGIAHGCSHFFQLVLPPLFPFLKTEFSVSYTELGLVMTLFYVTSGVLQTPAGFLVDRVGARNVLIGGLAIFCTGILLYGLVPSFWMLVPVAILAGIGNSVFHPADFSILNASVDQKRLGRAYGTHTLGGNLGWGLAPVLMAGGAALLGWRAAPIIAALIGYAILAALLMNRDLLKEDAGAARRAAAKAGEKAAPLGPLLSLPVVMCFGYFLLLSFALIGTQNFLPATLAALYGTPLTLATTALTGFLLGASAGVMVGGWIADRGVRLEAIVITGLLGAAALILLVANIDLPEIMLVAAITVAGFLQGMTTPSRDLIVRGAAPKGASGRVFGFVYSGLDAGSALAPLAIGLLLDHGQADRVLWFVAAMLGLTTLTAVAIRQTSARKPETA